MNKVVFVLRNRITKELNEKEIDEKFEEVEIMVWTDIHGHKSDKEVRNYLTKHKEVGEFKIELRLKGFKPAGTKAFDIWKDLVVFAKLYNYTISFDRNQQIVLLEKLYHDLPDTNEFESIIDKWMEAVVDSITQQLELIKQKSKR